MAPSERVSSATVSLFRRRLHAAAYRAGRVDVHHLFRDVLQQQQQQKSRRRARGSMDDVDENEAEEEEEGEASVSFLLFRTVVRRDARVSARDVTDEELLDIFELVGGDGCLRMSVADFVMWSRGDARRSSNNDLHSGRSPSGPGHVPREGKARRRSDSDGMEAEAETGVDTDGEAEPAPGSEAAEEVRNLDETGTPQARAGAGKAKVAELQALFAQLRGGGRRRGSDHDDAPLASPTATPESPESNRRDYHNVRDTRVPSPVQVPTSSTRRPGPASAGTNNHGASPSSSPLTRGKSKWGKIAAAVTGGGGSASPVAAVKAITSLKKGGRRRRARLATIAKVKRKMRAAAYTVGGVDYAKLFRHYDRDNSGSLELDEFMSAIRRDAKIPKKDVSDRDLEAVFAAVDDDGGGSVDIDEFVAWLEAEDDPADGRSRSGSAASYASSSQTGTGRSRGASATSRS